MTFLCIASYFKGEDFLKGCKQAGCTVYLATSIKHQDKPWPHEAIDEFFYVQQNEDNDWDMNEVAAGLAWAMRSRKIDRIVALDDFDVEKAAFLREHFRIPGMGQTTARYFRDKLAMRMKAQEAGINVPAFCALFNDAEINEYITNTAAPWLIKPRSEASATGIKKIHSAQEFWDALHQLGDKRHLFLAEQFRPGDVFHVDSLTLDKKVVFYRVSRYLATPMEVAHGGGIFRSATVTFGSNDEKALKRMNEQVIKAFGLNYSASHTEFIKCKEDGKFYFLETASRVGGAYLAEMVEFSSGINLWREWARLEAAVARSEDYKLPPVKNDYSGIIVSLARIQHPNTDHFSDSEIVWRMNKDYHVGLIVQSPDEVRVLALLDEYATRIQHDYHAVMPITGKPTS